MAVAKAWPPIVAAALLLPAGAATAHPPCQQVVPGFVACGEGTKTLEVVKGIAPREAKGGTLDIRMGRSADEAVLDPDDDPACSEVARGFVRCE